MALDGTYTGLKASVADWLNRADLTLQVPDFIAMAEAQMSRRLLRDGPVSGMMGRSDATINAEFIAVPTDFMGVKAFYLTPTYTPLQFIEPEKLIERKTLYTNTQGDPQFYSIVGGEFQFWPWSGSPGSYSAELTYWKRIPALSASNATNWLLTASPDAYLYGALAQSAPYLKADDRLPMWLNIYGTILDDLVNADKITCMAPMMQATMIVGGVNDGPRQNCF